MLFSIIIPVYNVEKYLVRCLDSIFNQNCNYDFEVIAVDDCSTDSSLGILRDYEGRFPNLKVIPHATNMKLSTARITGIKEAKGEYIVHIDSDDWIVADGLNIMADEIKNREFDVIVFNYFRYYSTKGMEKKTLFDQSIHQSNKDLLKQYFLGTCWNKVVKRHLHDDVLYGREGFNSEEDLLYCVEIMLKSSKFKLSSKCYYVYFQNRSSLTMSVDPVDFLYFKPIILNQLFKIMNRYNCSPVIADFVLDYFVQWVYLFVYKIHNSNLDNRKTFTRLMDDFSQNKELEKGRLSPIKKATNSYIISFYEVVIRFGVKLALSIFINFLLTDVLKKYIIKAKVKIF